MKDFWLYTLARFGMFAATYAVIVGVYLLVTGADRVPLLWPLVLAAVISLVASAYVLRGMRDRLAAGIQTRAEGMSRRFEEMKAKEDDD